MSVKTPLLVYDGDCGFCGYWISRWKRLTRDEVEYVPYQQLKLPFKGFVEKDFGRSVKLFLPDGRTYSAAEAVFRTLSLSPSYVARSPIWCYENIPGFAPASEFIYRRIAANRSLVSILSAFLWGRNYEPPAYLLTRWFFLKGLGIIYLIAFISLWIQISGLAGHNGILPVEDLIAAVKGRYGWEGIPILPTLCWFDTSDLFLHFLCFGGVVLSLLLILGFAPVVSLFLLWLFYLSLSIAGQEFLSFQWDILLLETGFLAIFFAPIQFLPNVRRECAPSRIIIWLYRWLLFRLMFMSGVVKLSSGDASWRDFTALNYHYETQPLPTWIGWFAHQLPAWFQRFSVGTMFAIELVVPFFIFGPRRLRHFACGAILFLQLLIFLTGNYCFFNLLAALLCLCLLDDSAWPRNWRNFIVERINSFHFGKAGSTSPAWPRWILIPLSILVLYLSSLSLIGAFRVQVDWPVWVEKTYSCCAPFRSVNGYGLFMVMTKSRPEIVVEGSLDGVEWLPYEFKYKPGDLKRHPFWVQPHQPRLDWQMWFAALGTVRQNTWFLAFCRKLMQGSPDVLALLEKNPFPGTPPRFLRAVVYEYHFTDLSTLRRDGVWWSREKKRLYCPIMSLEGDQLIPLSGN